MEQTNNKQTTNNNRSLYYKLMEYKFNLTREFKEVQPNLTNNELNYLLRNGGF